MALERMIKFLQDELTRQSWLPLAATGRMAPTTDRQRRQSQQTLALTGEMHPFQRHQSAPCHHSQVCAFSSAHDILITVQMACEHHMILPRA